MNKKINLKIVKAVGTALAMAGVLLCTGVCTIKAEDTTVQVTSPAKTPQVGGEEVTSDALGQVSGADRDIVMPEGMESTTLEVTPVTEKIGEVAADTDKIDNLTESPKDNRKVSVWPYVMMGLGAFMVSFIIGESIFVKKIHKKEK